MYTHGPSINFKNDFVTFTWKWALKTFFFDWISKPVLKVGLHGQSLLGRFNISVPATLCLPNKKYGKKTRAPKTGNKHHMYWRKMSENQLHKRRNSSFILLVWFQPKKQTQVHRCSVATLHLLVFQASQIRDPPKAPCLVSNDNHLKMK